MSVYRYPQSSPIDEVTFKKTANGAVRAYVHAREGIDPATIDRSLQTLSSAGMECIPMMCDGKPALEMRGFTKEKDLLALLEEKQLVRGTPAVHKGSEDRPSLWNQFKKRTLQLSGIAYLVGDYGFVSYGHKESDKLVVAGAVSYFLGTLSLIFYGRNDQSAIQIHDLAKNLKNFANEHDMELPKGGMLHHMSQLPSKTLLQSMDEFARRYPSEMFNSVTALAGVFIATSAYKNKVKGVVAHLKDEKAIREMRQEGWMDFGLGTLTTVSGVFATLVKEKKPDPDEPPASGMKWIWQKIQEHPLAIAGAGYTVSTGFHAASTRKAYKEAKRVGDKERLASIPGRALFVAMAFLSEFLLAISSKGHGEGVINDKSVDESVIAMASGLIVQQPESMRELLIDQMTSFLGAGGKLSMTDDKIKEQLHKQVSFMCNNPWAKAYISCEPENVAVNTQAWQLRLANEVDATPHLSV